MDIDRRSHLSDEDRTRDQEELISSLYGQRSSKPCQQKQATGNHFRQFARENRLVRQVTLLNLDFKPSTEWLEEFQETKHGHENSQEQR